MKAQYEKVFAAHVAQAVEKAVGLGIKATWSTAKHLDALAAVLNEIAESGGDMRDALGECYNVSAFQQLLAKKFEKSGHFQRTAQKTNAEQVDDLISQLAAKTNG